MAYYQGPDRYHASYSIRVKPVNLDKLEENESNSFENEFTHFFALVRINETVGKVN